MDSPHMSTTVTAVVVTVVIVLVMKHVLHLI